jgi:hypothetical protein
MDPLPNIPDYVRRPSFIPQKIGERFKQTDLVFAKAMRGEFEGNLTKIGAYACCARGSVARLISVLPERRMSCLGLL